MKIMSSRKFLEIQKVEIPETVLYYETIKVYVDEYPELQGKSDEEIVEYVKDNLSTLKSNNPHYDTLEEMVDDSDFDYEKSNNFDSKITVELYEEDENSDEEDDGEYYDDEEDD